MRPRKRLLLMQKFSYALVGLLFLPVSVFAPIAEAKTVADAQGEEIPLRTVAMDTSIATTLQVRLTSYNAVAWQTDTNPGVTASGIPSNSEVVAARSRDLAKTLPFGTVIAIYREGDDTPSCGFKRVEHLVGYRVVADTMNARFTKRVDVEFDSNDTVSYSGRNMNPSRVLGVCGNVTVRVIGRISLKDIPATQEELARIVESSTEVALASSNA